MQGRTYFRRFVFSMGVSLILILAGCSGGGGGSGAPAGAAAPSGSAVDPSNQTAIDANFAAALSINLVAVHDGNDTSYNSDCISCHGDESLGTASDGRADAHAAMIPWTPGSTTNAKCVWCHDEIELESSIQSGYHSTVQSASLGKEYNTERCLRCHFSGSEFEFYAD